MATMESADQKNSVVTRSSPDRGWQVGLPLQGCFGAMLENETLADATITVTSQDGGSRDFNVHKLVLSARSPVFEAMFSGNFKESSGRVEVENTDVEAFHQMLRYIYTDELDLTCKNFAPITNLSRKYILDGLLAKCLSFVEHNLEFEMRKKDVCYCLDKSLEHSVDEAKTVCLRELWVRAKRVFSSPDFLDLSREGLKCVLGCDTREYDIIGRSDKIILENVLLWAKKRCNENSSLDIKECLGDLVYDIRYSTLTPSEFVDLVAESDIMSETQKLKWLRYIATENAKTCHELSNDGFNVKSRGFYTVKRLRHARIITEDIISNSPLENTCNLKEESLVLCVDRKAKLVEIILSGARDAHATVNIAVCIEDESDYTTVFEFPPSSVKGLYFRLKPNIELLPNKRYLFRCRVDEDISQHIHESYYTKQHRFGGACVTIRQMDWLFGESGKTMFASFSFDFE